MLRRFLVRWAPVVLWMALIFGASTDIGASPQTSRIIEPILKFFFPAMSAAAVGDVVLGVRKCAHLCEYAVLAMLVWRARRLSRPGENRGWSWNDAAVALWVAGLYAATDEFHQTFVPSREGCVRDVLIDTCGATLGLAFLWTVGRLRKRR